MEKNNISRLYERHLYLNKDVDALVSTHIREYDMKSAGFNILKREGLIGAEFISYLSKLEKENRNIAIGNFSKSNSLIIDGMNNGLIKARREFFEANELQDSDVLSIKKDAIFLVNKIPEVTQFDGLEFVMKNSYTSYYYLDKTEFYFKNMGKKLHVKGIKKEKLGYHKEFMMKELKAIFSLAEQGNKASLVKRLRNFANNYRNYELSCEYYRELNPSSLYRINSVNVLHSIIGVEHVTDLDNIDISYNYLHYILPLIRLLF